MNAMLPALRPISTDQALGYVEGARKAQRRLPQLVSESFVDEVARHTLALATWTVCEGCDEYVPSNPHYLTLHSADCPGNERAGGLDKWAAGRWVA